MLSCAKLASARQKTVGTKQTLKALEKGIAKVVYIAEDAEHHVVEPVIGICEAKDIPIVRVDSMKLLGEICAIDVGCATASIIEE